MRFLVGALLLAIAHPGFSQTYNILINGAPAGTETVQTTPDGKTAAQVDLRIGTIQIAETLTVQFDGPTLVSSDSVTKSPQGNISVSYANGVVNASIPSGKRSVPFVSKGQITASNLVVPLWSSLCREAMRRLGGSDPGQDVLIRAYFIDIGAIIPVQCRSLPTRTGVIGGKTQSFSSIQVNLAGVQIELNLDSSGSVVAMNVPGQKLRLILAGYEGLYADLTTKYPELSQALFKVKRIPAAPMNTRDGVQLVSTVAIPDQPGRYPVILARTPYGRETAMIDAEFYASRGYAYVAQDVRGRGDSNGIWDPFVGEGPDGVDAIQWAAAQPWSSGEVGMIGGSYGGYVQWASAVLAPPALRCIVPQVSPPDAMHNLPYEYGVPFLFGNLWWGRIVASKEVTAAAMQTTVAHPEALTMLPLGKVDQASLGLKIPFFQTWLKRETLKDWKGFDFYQHLAHSKVPALQISGWYDGDGIGTKLIWARERTLGRKDQWLIEGPWAHAFNTASSIGKMDFGPTALIDLDSLYLRWFDTWLKHKNVGLDKVPHAQIFVTGLNRWLNLEDWPSTQERSETLYLAAKPEPALVGTPPHPESVKYDYDPAQDLDVSEVAHQDDPSEVTAELKITKGKTGGWLLFQTEPVKVPTVVAGPADLDLFFRTSAANTDLFVAVVDVDQAGKLLMVGQPGKLRASYLKGVDRIEPLVPNRVYEAHVMPWDFAHQLKPGHRLGIVLTSTMFPFYARNLGTIDPIVSATKIVVQHNELLFGVHQPSSFSYRKIAVQP